MASEGEQLTLFGCLFEGEPWQGSSPRALTRAAKALFLRPEPQNDDGYGIDPRQVDMWLPAKKAPRLSRGAPSLLPLK